MKESDRGTEEKEREENKTKRKRVVQEVERKGHDKK